jgi:hypothetical protein
MTLAASGSDRIGRSTRRDTCFDTYLLTKPLVAQRGNLCKDAQNEQKGSRLGVGGRLLPSVPRDGQPTLISLGGSRGVVLTMYEVAQLGLASVTPVADSRSAWTRHRGIGEEGATSTRSTSRTRRSRGPSSRRSNRPSRLSRAPHPGGGAGLVAGTAGLAPPRHQADCPVSTGTVGLCTSGTRRCSRITVTQEIGTDLSAGGQWQGGARHRAGDAPHRRVPPRSPDQIQPRECSLHGSTSPGHRRACSRHKRLAHPSVRVCS